ncbi:MAG: radical SAM protein [Dehalococcoidia bacterium]|nr:MAG: radical SAM protein [Dehalococcoidia bacterium]
MPSEVLLINSNITKPPVSPVGLEYVGEALAEHHLSIKVLDLTFKSDWQAALRQELSDSDPSIIGITVRNTDDCSYVSKQSYLPLIQTMTTEIKQLSQSPIVLGGVGFSIMPQPILELTGVDLGIIGDGEQTFTYLVKCIQQKREYLDLPNLVYQHQGKIVANKRIDGQLDEMPFPRRRLIDNKRYQELGAMVGIETKRGCGQKCIYCADPVAKGNNMRLRPPKLVIQELKDLLTQGVSWLHLSDSEFNLPLDHAKEICMAIINAGIHDQLKWYCYCSPIPFDVELAHLMKCAGCYGINFGVDSLCDQQLRRIGRKHTIGDIQRLVKHLKREQLNYMFDLLIGGPAETPETVKTSFDKIRKLNIPLVGISVGVRIYPKTSLAKSIVDGQLIKGLSPQNASHNFSAPTFFVSPYLGQDPILLLKEYIGEDPRFLFLSSPSDTGSYNYAGDDLLCTTIKQGARGAYWDIISRNPKVFR